MPHDEPQAVACRPVRAVARRGLGGRIGSVGRGPSRRHDGPGRTYHSLRAGWAGQPGEQQCGNDADRAAGSSGMHRRRIGRRLRPLQHLQSALGRPYRHQSAFATRFHPTRFNPHNQGEPQMIVVREVMHCKPGKVRPLVEKFLAMRKLMEKGGGKMRVMTDVSGARYWTLIAEMEVESLGKFEAMMAGEGMTEADNK